MKTLLFFVIIFLPFTYSQDENYYKITLKDGKIYEGKLLDENNYEITLEISDGVQVRISRDKIRESKQIQSMSFKKNLIKTEPNNTNLFISPTARIQDYGLGFIRTSQILFPSLSISPTDFFQISAGVSFFPDNSFKEQFKFVSPKVRIYHSENYHIGFGLTYLRFKNYYSTSVYLLNTLDGNPFSITGGLGFLYNKNRITHNPILLIGIERKISDRSKIISENLMHPDIPGITLSIGFRFWGEKFATDLGLFTNTAIISRSYPVLPYVGFEYNF